jgi:hypothetical protein
MAAGPKRRMLVNPLVEFVVDGQHEVRYGSAPFTDEVIVGTGVGIEAIKGTSKIDLFDESLLYQDIQIAIDGSHTEVGKLPLHLLIDPVRRGMTAGGSEELQNPFPLPAALVRPSLYTITSPKVIIGIIPNISAINLFCQPLNGLTIKILAVSFGIPRRDEWNG